MFAGPILITGGLGFLGSHLASRLSAAGEAVRILARPRRGPEAQDLPHEIVWGDVRDREAVDRAVRGTEVVYHLASNFRHAGTDGQGYAIHVDGTRNVLDACERHGVRQVVICSTFGVHGSVREAPGNEDSPLEPLDRYQETKLIAEQEALRAHQERGLPVTVLRPGSLYGPGDERLLKLFRMLQKGRFVMIGDGQPCFQPSYIDDVVEGFRLCLRNQKTIGETFIIASDEYLPIRQMVTVIAEELGVSPPRWRLPMTPIMAVARLCEAVCEPLGLEPPLHRRRVSFFHSNRAFSVDKAKQLLGFSPSVHLREGVRRTIGWYREKGWL